MFYCDLTRGPKKNILIAYMTVQGVVAVLRALPARHRVQAWFYSLVCVCLCMCALACVTLSFLLFLSVLYLLCQATNESSLLRRNLIWMNLTAAAKVRRAECHFNPINFNLLVIKELGC